MSILIGIIATIILFIIVIIHFSTHFTVNIHSCFKHNHQRVISPRQSQLAFYPSLWTLYITYLLLLSICIIITQTGIFPIKNTKIVYIICYGILLASCWESLFSYHRYCTLKQYMRHSRRMKTKLILKKFTLFAFIYILLFISQLHFIYWLFPLIITMYVLCNIFWQYQFIQMLLKQYSTLSTFDTVAASNIQDTMIKSVYIMGYCSISSTIISALSVFSLSVFCAFDTNYIQINLIHLDHNKYNLVSIYFPLFWCCSSFFYMFNFVRNRSLFKRYFLNIYGCITNTNINNNINIPISTSNRVTISKLPTMTATCIPSNISIINNNININTVPNIHRTRHTLDSCSSIVVERVDTNHTQNISQSQLQLDMESKLSKVSKPNTISSDKLTICSKCNDNNIDNIQSIIKPSLCLAPPTSINSEHFTDISSEDIEYDYKLNMDSPTEPTTIDSSPHNISIHIPVIRHNNNNNITAESITTDSSGYISNSFVSPKPQYKQQYIQQKRMPNIYENKSHNIEPLSVIKDEINDRFHKRYSCTCVDDNNSMSENEINNNNKGLIISIHRYNNNKQLSSYISQQYTIKPKGIVIVRDNSESELHQSVVIERVNRYNNNNKYSKINSMNKCKSVPIGIIDSVSSKSNSIESNSMKINKHCNKCKFMYNDNDDDDDIIDCYKENQRNKSHILTDMMVNYGWTDKSMLCSILGLKKSLSR